MDNFVSELAKCSRTRAEEIIIEQRVFINSVVVDKNSKKINEGDIITIRGKGRFYIKELLGQTKSGRTIIKVEKFV